MTNVIPRFTPSAQLPPHQDGRSPPKVAVADLSLMVGATESFGLLGPNGAGKTTTLRMMQGDEGQRDVLQRDVHTLCCLHCSKTLCPRSPLG